MTPTTLKIVRRFGCTDCRYFDLPSGRGEKTSCTHPRVKGKHPIRYLKGCPKRPL